MDSLAEKSVLFQNVLASISHTSPSHASIFTSLHPLQHKVLTNGWLLPESAFTMAEMFDELGYETAGFCSVEFLRRMVQGFYLVEQVKYQEKAHYRQAHHTIRSALDWLKEKKPSDKFFLWIHLFDPHKPYYPPENVLEKLKFKTRAEQEEFIEFLIQNHKLPADFYVDTSKLIEDYNNYDAEVLFVDRQIKRLFNHMEEKGFNSNTLWIITSDHGEGLGNHYFYDHSERIYREQIKVPLIFYSNDQRYAGKRIDTLVRHVDILPTLSEMMDYPLDKKSPFIQGISLLPLLENPDFQWPLEYAFYQRKIWDDNRPGMEPGELFAFQDLNFKYILHTEGKDEFFNLSEDPFEMNNIIDIPSEEKEKIKSLLKQRIDYLAKHAIEGRTQKIDKKVREELKALGYIR